MVSLTSESNGLGSSSGRAIRLGFVVQESLLSHCLSTSTCINEQLLV